MVISRAGRSRCDTSIKSSRSLDVSDIFRTFIGHEGWHLFGDFGYWLVSRETIKPQEFARFEGQREYSKINKIGRVYAFKELSDLVSKKIFKQVGKGRAIHYIMSESVSD